MRSTITAALLIFLSPAALAASPVRDADIAAALPSPTEVDAMGSVIGRVMSAMLDIEVGGLVEAIDPASPDARPGRTLGDLAHRDDPYFEERMHRSVDATVANMDDMMADIAILAPRLLRSFDQLSRDIEDATQDLPSRR